MCFSDPLNCGVIISILNCSKTQLFFHLVGAIVQLVYKSIGLYHHHLHFSVGSVRFAKRVWKISNLIHIYREIV